jgi:hypothetical protein
MITVTRHETITTPVGNPARWLHANGPTSEYKRAAYALGAEARKIAKEISPVTHAHRLTSGTTWNGPEKIFEERVLYVFSNAEKI